MRFTGNVCYIFLFVFQCYMLACDRKKILEEIAAIGKEYALWLSKSVVVERWIYVMQLRGA